jgi:hypothetical protein
VAAKGPFVSGTVSVYRVDLAAANGRGALVASGSLDAASTFTIPMPEGFGGPILLEVFPGRYHDSARGGDVDLPGPLRAGGVYVPPYQIDNITALNHIALERALAIARVTGNFSAALTQSTSDVEQDFSLPAGSLESASALALTSAALGRIDTAGLTQGSGSASAYGVTLALAAFASGGSVGAGALTTGSTPESVFLAVNATVPARPAVLSIAGHEFSSGRIPAGGTFTADILLANSGGVSAVVTSAELLFTDPAVSAVPASPGPLTVTARSSERNGTRTLRFLGAVASDATSGPVSASVRVNYGSSVVGLARFATVELFHLPPPSLRLSTPAIAPARVRSGQSVTVTVAVTNTGGTTASGLGVSLAFAHGGADANAEFSTTPISVPVTGLAPGASSVFGFSAVAPAVTTAENFSITGRATASNAPAAASASASFTVLPRPAILSIQRAATSTSQLYVPSWGTSSATFSVIVTNSGGSALNGISVIASATPSDGIAITAHGDGAQTLPGGVASTYTFTVDAGPAATAGPVLISAIAEGTDADDQGLLQNSAGTTLTLQPTPSYTPLQPAAVLQAPGGIVGTSLVSGQSTLYSTTVTLTLTPGTLSGPAALGDFSLTLSSDDMDVTTQYTITAGPAPNPISASQTRTMTWRVTALSSAPRGRPVTLAASFTSQEQYNVQTAPVTSYDRWKVGYAATRVLGQASLYSRSSTLSASVLGAPRRMVIDSAGRVLVADSDRNRILMFESESATAASTVIGQVDMTHSTANGPTGGSTVDGRCLHTLGGGGMAIDGTRLYVADTQNNRILIFDNYPQLTNAGGQAPVANGAIGQLNLTSHAFNRGTGPAANTLQRPWHLVISGNALIVADLDNSRVLVYDRRTIGDGFNASAVSVFGQSSLTRSGSPSTVTASSLYGPMSVLVANGSLLVCDTYSNRILQFDGLDTDTLQPVLGPQASKVFGQPSFTATTTTELRQPADIAILGNRLLVANGDGKVKIFSNYASSPTSGSVSTEELGNQPTPATGPQSTTGPSATIELSPGSLGPTPFSFRANGLLAIDPGGIWIVDGATPRAIFVPMD